MRKTTFITRIVWDSLDRDLRKAILIKSQMRRDEIINKMFASNLENKLRELGEHDLANMLFPPEELSANAEYGGARLIHEEDGQVFYHDPIYDVVAVYEFPSWNFIQEITLADYNKNYGGVK